MSLNIEHVLHPNEAFQEYQSKLLSIYEADYGEEEMSIIKNRMNHTLYMFDSDPLEMMIFLDEYEEQIHDREAIQKIEDEYANYIKVMDKTEQLLNKELLKYIAGFFHIPWRKAPKELLDLDFDAFSYQSERILQNPTIRNLRERVEIEQRRKEYLEKCQELGVEPLTYVTYIQFILEEKDKMESLRNQRLLKKTKWGQRIVKRLRQYHPQFDIDKIDTIMRMNRLALTSYAFDDLGRRNGIWMYYPLVEKLDIGASDRVLLHENRHVIESNPYVSGVTGYGIDSDYRLINEVRTEYKAMKDEEKLSPHSLWGNGSMSEKNFSPYERLIPYTHSWFDEYREDLNDFALHGRFSEFEEMFGKDNLLSFEKFLEEMYCYLKEKKQDDLVEYDCSQDYIEQFRSNANRVR